MVPYYFRIDHPHFKKHTLYYSGKKLKEKHKTCHYTSKNGNNQLLEDKGFKQQLIKTLEKINRKQINLKAIIHRKTRN